MSNLTIRPATPADMEDVARLCWAYRALLIEREAGLPPMTAAFYPEDSYRALIADLPRIHARPKGDILLAQANNAIVGCAMYYPIHLSGVAELKRVYVDPTARGLGAGRKLIQTAMTRARADGFTRMVLDTMAPLTEAIALYTNLGFQPCAPYYDEPVPAHFLPHLRCFDHPL